MLWRNTTTAYGLVSILLHWLIALASIGLFILGLWMVELSYYDKWYNDAPAIHKAAGILLLILVVLRLGWRLGNPLPTPIGKPIEQRFAYLVHGSLYLLLFATLIAGYLISTADGRPIDVFGLFNLPATLTGLPNQEDIAGLVHMWLAWLLIVFTLGHSLAALKHHFVDRDATLRRMFRITESHSTNT